MKRPTLSIVLPFYNEEDIVEGTLKDVVAVLSRGKISYEIVAVQNGSWDNTAKIIHRLRKKNSRITICTVVKNLGYGYGVLQGLKQTTGRYVGYMWGDGQISPDCLLPLLHDLQTKNIDLAKITRVHRPGYSVVRRIESLGYNILFYLLFGVGSRDINGCPKLMTRDCYENLSLQSWDWFLDAEVMIKLKQKRYRFSEVPVIFKKRKGGTSHVRLSAVTEFLKNMINARMGRLWKTR